MIVAELVLLYGVSYFAEVDFNPNVPKATPRDRGRAFDEYVADPMAVFEENIEQARRDVTETEARLRRSHEDGLFDRDAYKAATTKERKAWVTCVSVVRGDYGRALGELAHWRGYAAAHIGGTLPMPKSPTTLAGLVGRLAPGPDRESPDDGVPF